MWLKFLGTCGGRFAVVRQIRASGGFIVNMGNEYIHIDPGPGAVARAKQFGFDIEKVSMLLISHSHPDHYTDAEIVIEAMTSGTKKKRGVVVGNSYLAKANGNHRQLISPYHLDAVERYFILEPGRSIKVKGLEITATPTRHEEGEGMGFVINDGSEQFGYTADTAYFDGLGGYFKGCDVLVINVMKPDGKLLKGHMNTEQAALLIDETRPRLAIIQHFGIEMLFSHPERQAKYIESKTGTRVIAAKDGMEIDTKREIKGGLGRYL